MNKEEFIAGKYGISHGVITLLSTIITTCTGAVIGQYFNSPWVGALIGNLAGAFGSLIFYYSREVAQGHSWNPKKWGNDGQLDLLIPMSVVVTNITIVLLVVASIGNHV